MTPLGRTAFLLAALSLAVATALPAPAQSQGRPRPQDRTTCFNMAHAFDELAKEIPDNPNLAQAKETAERGRARCQSGAPRMGIGLLENAFGMLGELPQGRR